MLRAPPVLLELDGWLTFRTRRPPGLAATPQGLERAQAWSHCRCFRNLIISRNDGSNKRMLLRAPKEAGGFFEHPYHAVLKIGSLLVRARFSVRLTKSEPWRRKGRLMALLFGTAPNPSANSYTGSRCLAVALQSAGGGHCRCAEMMTMPRAFNPLK